ncbi:ricin-type beta-trefoil lectin domain protein [Streptomyces antibioticus]|uniref:ricin-type beta-trefoil lectin domain protein n=1 Tax=Streptomyces antibioticus TaxID=1890 RepID=UPI0036DC345B
MTRWSIQRSRADGSAGTATAAQAEEPTPTHPVASGLPVPSEPEEPLPTGAVRSSDEADADADGDADTDVDTDVDTDADADSEPDANTDTDTDADAGADDGSGEAEATAAGTTAAPDTQSASEDDEEGDAPGTTREVSKQAMIGVGLLALLVTGTTFMLLGGDGGDPEARANHGAQGKYADESGGAGGIPGVAPASTASPSPLKPPGQAAGTADGGKPQSSSGGSGPAAGPGPGTGGGGGRPVPAKNGTGAQSTSSSGGAGTSAAGSGSSSASSGSTGSSNSSSGTAGSTPLGGAATSATVTRLTGYASGRCVDVPDGQAKDGTPLQIWDCTNVKWQKWSIRSDGTVRSLGLCMDLAWASGDNGTAIQAATCNGGWAQQFRLTAAGDLVNPKTDKCVDVRDEQTSNGARLQLWPCTGTPSQKWYRS